MVILAACKKSFLEVTPKGKLIAQKVADYDMLLNNLDLLNTSAGNHILMGDEIAASQPDFGALSVLTQRCFHWDDVLYEPGDDAAELTVPMRNIYTYNMIINNVMDAAEGTEQQKKSIRGEAVAGRAWTYFLLINYFGKPYSAATAATDLGFPIVRTADATETKFTRASVKEVYDFIVNDLVTAIPDLPLQVTSRLRMSKPAAEALLGKVYVFMGKYADAIPQFNAAITDAASSAIPVRLYDYNSTFAPGGAFTPIGFFGPPYPTTPKIEENIYAKQIFNAFAFSSAVTITPETVALYGASDLRLNFYSPYPFGGSSVYPDGMLRRVGPTVIQLGVVLPDLYLLRAECKARLNDLAGAKTDVETLRGNRMPAADAPVPAAIAADQVALTKFILEERIREFASEGYRWFDMRRLSIDDAYKSTVGYTHRVYDASGVTDSFTLKPQRLVLRFSPKIMAQNPGMTNND
ncbi:RagB/SusD family nutrient uptake outer membrane protein [Chitinophaga eiseniae]|uniref:RagB/SusD family nutrient uptake outer membrane protein n=2 Tax=Chitinophaga eiseniae TaxID=634771 RepID=A0A847SJ11_9BACT|nr:RagB/SusD family nutrient uptake outer membrane protein [Chitinophaga eiseniae]